MKIIISLYMNKNIKSTKSNQLKLKLKNFFINKKLLIFLLLSICVIFASEPKKYANSCLNAITIWSVNVLPVLFPFFVLTNIIVMLAEFRSNKIDKFFSKIYRTSPGASTIYFLSVLSGYPVGAKLVTDFCSRGLVEKTQAENMLSFCCISGPMFILGTVGICMFSSMKFGLIILISNILASLINGLFYCKNIASNNINYSVNFSAKNQNNILSKSVYDSMINILLVGAYICMSFLLIDMLNYLSILNILSSTISSVSFGKISPNIVKSTLIGFIEITRGSLEFSRLNLTQNLCIPIVSGIIGFGGLSVFMQSISFLNNIGINKSRFFKQKITQGIFASVIAYLISLLIY